VFHSGYPAANAVAGATRFPGTATYVCHVTRRDRIPRLNRAQLRGAKRYTQGAY